jgi:hypothetical protein
MRQRHKAASLAPSGVKDNGLPPQATKTHAPRAAAEFLIKLRGAPNLCGSLWPAFWQLSVASYYVNNHAQPTGEHEVHQKDCIDLPQVRTKTYLGEYAHCSYAVRAARIIHSNVDGCAYGGPDCHTR